MVDLRPPALIPNFIDGKEVGTLAGDRFEKRAPADGRVIAEVARSRADGRAGGGGRRALRPAWLGGEHRGEPGDRLRAIALLMRDRQEELAGLVAKETGKSLKDARGETGAAIEMGMFVAGEGRRFYGRTTTSAIPNKTAQTVRQPLGVTGLIIAANTPIANVAWKVFPALLCGNAAVLKPAEDTPLSAWAFARLAQEAGLPPGVLNVVHGLGEEAGAALVESPEVDLISFTGSTAVGRWIAQAAGARLAKVCLELGGKNPLIVCDDADLDRAAEAAVLSAFSNAGQRCAAGSRIIVFDAVYEAFRERLLRRVAKLRVGCGDEDDFGPVINEAQLVGDVRRDRGGSARRRHRAHRRPPTLRPWHTMAGTSWSPRCWRTRTRSRRSPGWSCSGRSPCSTGYRTSRPRLASPTAHPTGSRPPSTR